MIARVETGGPAGKLGPIQRRPVDAMSDARARIEINRGSAMTTTVCIKNADWVVAWDAPQRRHAYLEHGDVVFADSTLTFVGRNYSGAADQTIDGRGLMVMPGLIDIHAHPGHEASYRGIREEHGVPEMYMSGLFERGGAYWPDEEGRLACAEAAYCELLASGVTALVDISPLYPGWVELMARSGLRGVLAPGYASARWIVRRSHLLEYEWNEAAGRQKFEAALRDGVAHADRHVHGGPPARQRRRGAGAQSALDRPLRSGGRRVPRDGAPAWHHADSVGASDRPRRPRDDLRSRDLRRRALVAALVVAPRHRDHGQHGHVGRALPDAVRPVRSHAGGFREVPTRRHQRGNRNRHRAAEPAGGDALGDGARAHRRRGHPQHRDGRRLPRGDGGRRASAPARRHRPDRPRGKGGSRPGRSRQPVDDARAGSVALAHLSRRRSGGARRLRRWPTGGGERPRAHPRPGRRARAADRSPAAHGGARARAR